MGVGLFGIIIKGNQLQKSKIEWTEFVSNPIKGKYPEEFEKIINRKKPTTIFMGSMYDIWCDGIPINFISRILNCVIKCPQHTFLFLTKNPKRYLYYDFPSNCYLGYTDTGDKNLNETMYDLLAYKNPDLKIYVSFEPLLGDITWLSKAINTIIIGAMTGTDSIIPQKRWVDNIIARGINLGIPIFIKDNLYKIYPDLPRLRETAWSLNK